MQPSLWVRFCVVWYELVRCYVTLPVYFFFDLHCTRFPLWFVKLLRDDLPTGLGYLFGEEIAWYWARPVIQEHWERQALAVRKWKSENPDYTYEQMCEYEYSWNRSQGRRV